MENAESNQRLGLGLSGGGFRASFYHVGVLAKMAELGMLKPKSPNRSAETIPDSVR